MLQLYRGAAGSVKSNIKNRVNAVLLWLIGAAVFNVKIRHTECAGNFKSSIMLETDSPNLASEKPAHGQLTPLGLRGNYANARTDYAVAQEWDAYSAQDHDRWRRLYQQQLQLVDRFAADAVREAIAELNCADAIPDCADISVQLYAKTGWRLVPVPGLIPWPVFFTHLAARRFPVTVWIRDEAEFEFVPEPDIFHDFFGHVPLLFNPVFCDALVKFAQKWLTASAVCDPELMTRIYWYIFEYGMVEKNGSLKAFGAALLSSSGAMDHAIQSHEPHRFKFSLDRCMRTEYEADTLQNCYFVIDGWQDFIEKLNVDIISHCMNAMKLPTFKSDDPHP